ncbi:MAG: hypothetical protein A2504_03755 [Bdellovibrionales bacterium RIFOXYD12_FULL_39_22]|nr:MAG: hypothetical protein A2404_12180 [Bdellovibrionales bacterium RIFOXYC1_FULL_39_130]OFZ92771.1 MAG: hypothetical protein A2504_03755 [Bdellovibrionales bacterium RIFOXYD12_FULL_39_22]HLE12560.1 hypothetical protein [Bacteriovoracaceae bacterium]
MARIGASLLLTEDYSADLCERGGYYFGFSLGALYFGLKEDSGIISNLDRFNLLFGLNLGYKF